MNKNNIKSHTTELGKKIQIIRSFGEKNEIKKVITELAFIHVKNLIGTYFAEKSVRYLSVYDNIDTDKGYNQMVSIYLAIHEMYPWQVSVKVRDVKKRKAKRGEFKQKREAILNELSHFCFVRYVTC